MAIKANLIIDQGTDATTTVTVTDDYDNPVDLSNFTGYAQIRKHFSSMKFYSFVVTLDEHGNVNLHLPANVSNTMEPGRYVYDCKLVHNDDEKQSRVVEGLVTINPQVTRWPTT